MAYREYEKVEQNNRGLSKLAKVDSLIRVNTVVHQPFLTAINLYERYSKIPFFLDLMDYLMTGLVVSDPRYFAMGKIILKAKPGEEEKPTLFVRCAVGDIRHLVSLSPCIFPSIAFCRRGEERMRVYDMPKFLRLVKATKK